MLEAAPVRVTASASLPASNVPSRLPVEVYSVPVPVGLLVTGVRPVTCVA